MRVLVCGGRDYADEARVHRELNSLASAKGWLTVIEGGNKRGGDLFARNWARKNYHGLVTVEAKWDEYGKAAGPLRNSDMLVYGQPDVGLAFPSEVRGLEGTGTGDMVEKLWDAGVPVVVIGYEMRNGVWRKATTEKGLGLT